MSTATDPTNPIPRTGISKLMLRIAPPLGRNPIMPIMRGILFCLISSLAEAAPTTLTFDNLPINTAINRQYQNLGIVFSSSNTYSRGYIVNDSRFVSSPVLSAPYSGLGDHLGMTFVTPELDYRAINSLSFDFGMLTRSPNIEYLDVYWSNQLFGSAPQPPGRLRITKSGLSRINISDPAGFTTVWLEGPLFGDDEFNWRIDNVTFDAAPGNCANCTPAGTLEFVSPYRLNAPDLRKLDLAALLPNPSSAAAAVATGIARDQTSAAIALFRTRDGTKPVVFDVGDGATLLPFVQQILTTKPGVGSSTLTVPTSRFVRVGSDFIAPVMVQSNLRRDVVARFELPIVVGVRQGTSARKTANLQLVPPPVIFIHGLWGDRDSLAAVKSFLTSKVPWSRDPAYLRAIEYPKFLPFDAGGFQAPATILRQSILDVFHDLDGKGIVAGRVDVVAHSMGGLVSRHYASLPTYRSPRNRFTGDIHTIVTLNTPQLGSALGTYLTSTRIRNATWQPGRRAEPWVLKCGFQTATIEQCFAAAGQPLLGADNRVESGAVYSLRPGVGSLAKPSLPGPNIEGAIWRTTVTSVDATSPVPFGLNLFLTSITPIDQRPDTVSTILGTSAHDGVVTLKSQAGPATTSQKGVFSGLAHSGFAFSVLSDLDVHLKVACWLRQSGSVSICGQAAAAQSTMAKTSSETQTGWKGQFDFGLARDLVLGQPVELAVNLPEGGWSRIVATQFDKAGHIVNEQLAVRRSLGRTAYVELTPKLLGHVRIKLVAEFADGGAAYGWNETEIAIPANPPQAFRADGFVKQVFLERDGVGTSYRLRPEARFGSAGGFTVDVAPWTDFDLAPGSAGTVIALATDGTITAKEKGEVVVEARFGNTVDRISVVVD